VLEFRLGVALLAAVNGLTGNPGAEAEIGPGMALSPEDLPPEAEHYERLLRGDPTGDSWDGEDDSVDERRHFNDHVVHVGMGTGFGTPLGMAGAFLEANPWDALALGMGGGVTFWGPAGGAYVRLRPFAWGGHGQRVLHAVTLQTSYTYMRDGELRLMTCIHTPCDEVGFLNRTAQLGALSAGFEHQLASGWTFRYDFGVARALFATPWECARYDTGAAAACSGYAPTDTLFVGTFAISHAL
jgi:hypothetical protein